MSELLGGAKLPKMDALKKERRELSKKKKALHVEYRKAQPDMRQDMAVNSMEVRNGLYDCAGGRISGAVKMAGVWLLPKDAEKPIDGRTKQIDDDRELSA